MSSGNPSGLSSATTYQAIVIALVAAGIIAIGVMSVCYRRRRRDEWERTVRAGLERARFRHRFGEGVGLDGDGIGEKPVLWDVDIGGEGDDWLPIRMGMDGSRRPAHATMTPNSLTQAPNISTSADSTPKTQVELTILIAMPHPPYPSSSDRPSTSRSQSMQSVNLDSETFELGKFPHYQHNPLTSERRTEDEEEEIPHIELGTTVVSIHMKSEEEEDAIQDIRLGSRNFRAGIASDWGGVRA